METPTAPVGPPEPPRLALPAPPIVRLDDRTVRAELPVSQLFLVDERLANSVQVGVYSDPGNVVRVWKQREGLATVVVLERLGPGRTTLVVELFTYVGSSVYRIPVTVVGHPDAPRPVGRNIWLQLREGGESMSLPITDLFSVGRSQMDSVVVEVVEMANTANVRLEGSGVRTVVVIEPKLAGGDHMLIRMSNAVGSALLRVGISVVSDDGEAPRPNNRYGLVTLTDGGSPVKVFLSDLFEVTDETGRIAVEVDAVSENAGVAAASYRGLVSPKHVVFSPVGPGTTNIVLTARKSAGSATLRVPVTVREAEPLYVLNASGPLVFLPGAQSSSVSDNFAPPGYRVEALSEDERVVSVEVAPFSERGGVRIWPREAGETNVVVTAKNAVSEAQFVTRVTVLDKIRIGLFNGLGSPDATVRLSEGARWQLDVRLLSVDEDYRPGGISWLALPSVGVATDAPDTELRVPDSVPGDPLGEAFTPIPLPIEALTDNVEGESDASYSVTLAPVPGLPSWVELSETPVRVVVTDSPAAACDDLQVTAALDRRPEYGPEYGMLGTIVIWSPHQDTSLSFAGPYVERVGHRPMATDIFPEELPLRETSAGFEQTVRLRWWDGDLRFVVEVPGCDPVPVVCDSVTCHVQ